MKGKPMHLKKAKVTSINDPDKKGKVQIRILPEMWEVEKGLLPWVRPFMNEGFSANTYSLKLPEVNSFVWIFFLNERMFEDGYYITGQFIDGLFDFDSVADRIEKVDGAEKPEYPNLDFTLSRGNRLTYENTATGEWGVLQKDGMTIVCDAFGGLVIKNSSSNFTIDGDGGFVFNNGSGNFTMNGVDDTKPGEVTINGNFTVKV